MGRLNWNRPPPSEEGPAKDPALEGWEIPPAAAPAPDPWLGPGSLRATDARQEANVVAPFQCHVCGAALRIEGAFAQGGDVFCFEHRPRGAVAGIGLPAGFPVRSGFTGPSNSAAARRLKAVVRWVWTLLASEVKR